MEENDQTAGRNTDIYLLLILTEFGNIAVSCDTTIAPTEARFLRSRNEKPVRKPMFSLKTMMNTIYISPI